MDKLRRVLEYWHAVEFFVPFDLDEIRSRQNAQYVLTETQLIEQGNKCMPWISELALHC